MNSALHRARTALEARVGPRGSWSPEETEPVDRALLQRYLSAWESGDYDAVVALLHEEATFSMPPVPGWFSGRAAIAGFFQGRFCASLRTAVFRGRLVEANGQPAIAFYRGGDDGRAHFFAVHLVTARDGHIDTVDHFLSTRALGPFLREGVPESVEL